MTNQPIPLDQLEIIGYADVLPNRKGPAVVPPVFRDRNDASRCFLPPFRIAGKWLVDPQLVSAVEVQELAKAERISLPPGLQCPARPDWQLWVGLDGSVHYEPSTDAKRNLRNLYREHLEAATAALREGDIAAAELHAGIALAADDRALEPDALIAACHALRGEEKHVAFLRRQAEAARHSPESFGLLMKSYVEMIPAETWDTLSFEAARAACEKIGVNVCRWFELPLEVSLYVGPVLQNALVRHAGTSIEIQCGGSDAAFLAEFTRLFKHNLLSKLTGGQVAEVVRKAFWGTRNRRSSLATWPNESIEGYFLRLGVVLVETGVIWFIGRRHEGAAKQT
jgi:hypothetical protein